MSMQLADRLENLILSELSNSTFDTKQQLTEMLTNIVEIIGGSGILENIYGNLMSSLYGDQDERAELALSLYRNYNIVIRDLENE